MKTVLVKDNGEPSLKRAERQVVVLVLCTPHCPYASVVIKEEGNTKGASSAYQESSNMKNLATNLGVIYS